MSKPEYEVALEGLNKNIKNLEFIAVQSKGKANPVYNMQADPIYLHNMGQANTEIEKFAKSLQSIGLGGKLTVWFGLFDKDYKDLKAKKSEILKKLNVKGYTYDRHWWNYYYRKYMVDNVFYMINNMLGNTQWAIKALMQQSANDVETQMKSYYAWVEEIINKHFAGKGKGKLKSTVMALNLGDGFQVRTHKKINLQDDPVQMADIFDFIEAIQKVDFTTERRFDKAAIKDLEGKLKSIIGDFNVLNKSNNAGAKTIGAKYIKNCTTYLALFCSKLDEFYESDLESLKIVYTEMVKVLNGLYDYKGE